MKVLGINGSARRDGNTAIMINKAFEELNASGIETELVQLGGSAAARRGGALNTIDAMNHFFLVQDMYVVGSSYWGMAYGRMPGEVEQDNEGMETMISLGRNMAH